MQDCGANTAEIDSFLAEVNSLKYFCRNKTSGLHPNVKAFLDFTRVIEEGKPHEIAAAYLGREETQICLRLS
jgi:hypothetical protein